MMHEVRMLVSLNDLEELFFLDKCNFICAKDCSALFLSALNCAENPFRHEDIYIFYKNEDIVQQTPSANILKTTAAEWEYPGKFQLSNGNTVRLCRLDREEDIVKYGGAECSRLYFAGLEEFTEQEFLFLYTRLRRTKSKRLPDKELKGIVQLNNIRCPRPKWLKEKFEPYKGNILIPKEMETWLNVKRT